MTDRRGFLKASAALWAAGTLGAANRPLRAAGCGRGNDGLCNSKYLLLDHRVVQQTEGVMLVLGKVRKHPGPLFREEKPWEVRYDNLYANVIFDDQQQIFKCWYSPFTIDTATSNTRESQRPNVTYRQALSKHRRREMGVCYATRPVWRPGERAPEWVFYDGLGTFVRLPPFFPGDNSCLSGAYFRTLPQATLVPSSLSIMPSASAMRRCLSGWVF